MIQPSASESARFGCSVGRLSLTGDDALSLESVVVALGDSSLDLVIVRYPASWVDLFDRLTRLEGWRAIFADALLYFEWADAGAPLDVGRAVVRGDALSKAEVGALIEEIFAGYTNHYAANPSLDRTLIAVGYAEWATTVATDPANTVLAVLDDGEVAGLAVVDTRGDEWDIVLAGVRPRARSKGAYADLMRSVMHEARSSGRAAVRISTQSHNVQVMRTWERLGFRITGSWITVHVTRADPVIP